MWVSIVKLQLSTLNINHALRTNSQHRLNNQLAATALHDSSSGGAPLAEHP